MNKSKSFITVQTCAGSSTERATVLVRMLRMSAIVLQQQQGLVLLFPSTSSKFRGDLPVHSKQRGTQQLQKLSALRPHLVGERPCICRFARVGVLKYNFLLPLSRSGGGGFLTVGRMSSNLAAAGPPPVSSKDDGNAKETKTVNVIIKGKVQGVYYRDWTLENAKKLGVNGWVRNLRDGSVEAVFSGQSAAVSTLIENCHTGPSAARVTSVDVSAWTEEVPVGFERKSTG